ncbi:DciA family protein [Streptomyces yangpuensis]|uniref:DciA family protein n=1 Tax=Streptomyces yangpuensis TaxID=1648182 RepID=UPI003650DA6D
MITTVPPAGADLARIALRQAKESARRRGGVTPKPKASVRINRADGRDPRKLASVLERFLVDSGWEKDAKTGDLLDRWSEIVGPERAHHWRAAAYDRTTRTLTVLCDSSAWAATLSMLSKQVIGEVNRALAAKPSSDTTPSQTDQVLTAIKVRQSNGSRQSDVDARTPLPRQDQPPPRPVAPNVPTTEFADARSRMRQAKLDRDTARGPRYVPFTPLRIQAAEEEHLAARYFGEDQAEQNTRAADVERRALRFARAERAARKNITISSLLHTERQDLPERILR